MLTPEQLDRYPEALIQLWAQVELDIIVDIARRILKTNFLTPTAKWQYQKVREMRQLEEYILQKLAALTKKSRAELKQIFEDAAVKTVESDNEIYEAAGITPKALEDSPALKTVVEEGLKQTESLYKNLTGTIANTVTKQFEDALDHAYLQVISGAFTPQQAIRGAIKALAAAGMQTITYPSGHRDHMDVAIRRATLTGINQTCARVQLRHAEEMGCDLVQVTSHLGARPTHAVWQGRIFSRSGKHPKYPDFVSSTGYGTGAGLCGWNCHHNFFPFFEGLSVDTYKRYDVEENNRVYAQSQKQRAFERKIRKDKRECAAFDETGQKDDFNRSVAKLKKHEAELQKFLKTTNFYRRRDREQVLEFGRSQSSKAVWANRKAEKAALNCYVSGESFLLNAKLRAGIPLSKEEQQLADTLERAILKQPKFEGIVYRSLRSEDMDDWDTFDLLHQVGRAVRYRGFTSTSKAVYDKTMDVQLVIKCKTGRDLKGINDAEKEVLYAPNSKFIVLNRKGKTILLEEVP